MPIGPQVPHDPHIHQKKLWPTLLNEFASQKHLKSAEMAGFSLEAPISADLKGFWLANSFNKVGHKFF